MDNLSPKAKYDISYMIYHGISEKIDSAIRLRQKEDIPLLEELVNYYTNNLVLSGSYLREKLDQLRNI